MSNIPISALPTTTTVSPSAILILDQNGTTYQGTVAQILTNVSPVTGGSGSGNGSSGSGLTTAPTIRQSSYASPLGSSSTQAFNNTTTAGNTLLFFGINTSGSISASTGWTQLGNANGLFCFYKTATGTSADNFAYSGFTGNVILAEFSSTGTPYNFTTTSTGAYSYNAPILTTTGPAIVIAFFNCNSGQPSLTSPGWTISWQTGSDFGNQRSIVVGWIQTSSSKDVSFSSLTDDNNTRYIAQFALGN